MFCVLAIDGRPVVLSRHATEDDAQNAFAPLNCPSLLVRHLGSDVEVRAVRGLAPAQVDTALLEAVRRVCGRVEAAPPC